LKRAGKINQIQTDPLPVFGIIEIHRALGTPGAGKFLKRPALSLFFRRSVWQSILRSRGESKREGANSI
jgi:hypothetical protein